MRYLGLDLSTVSTGWAVFDDDKLVNYGKICPSASMAPIEKMRFIANEIGYTVGKHVPNKVIIEDVFYGKCFLTTKVLNRLAGAVVYSILESGIRVEVGFVMPTAARKYMGLLSKSPEEKKKPSKSLIVRAVNAKFGTNFRLADNDMADAAVIGYYGYREDHEPDLSFKKTDQKFYKTGPKMGVRTKKMKGLIDG